VTTEFENEPIPGLPEAPPEGEAILWQGKPRWMTLARRAFHVRKVAVYFALLILLYLVSDILRGSSYAVALQMSLWLALLTLGAAGVLALLAWAMARSTIYTITTRRVVMRFGVAIQLCINLPFAEIVSAAVKRYPDGTGDIPLALTPGRRVSYIVLWPHARPWHFSPVQPMLRAVGDAEGVAKILADALAQAAQTSADAGTQAGTEDGSGGEVDSMAKAFGTA
jgi:hypothetical protein